MLLREWLNICTINNRRELPDKGVSRFAHLHKLHVLFLVLPSQFCFSIICHQCPDSASLHLLGQGRNNIFAHGGTHVHTNERNEAKDAQCPGMWRPQQELFEVYGRSQRVVFSVHRHRVFVSIVLVFP